ncbi:hypothetical protein DFH06DRAFT_1380833 [Mycena polygramma]|nr:hypothetical protein DFH06DRAFT_1380833 [Mycena polygramma]
MIHLDRNHHPSPLSTTTQNKDLILPTNPISWPALDDDFPADEYPQVDRKQPQNPKGPMTPTDQADPRPASGASSPASPADGNSASPTRERSSSLSPCTRPPAPPQTPPQPRPPPSASSHHLQTTLRTTSSKQDDATEKLKDTASSAPASPPPKPDDHDVKPSQQSSNLMPASSPSTRPSPLIDSIATPSAAGTEPTSPTPGDPKVAVMLELNEELLKVCMEFQKRRMALSEPQFQAYSARLQTNLAWSASVVDHGRQGRIQELYMELPTVFAKEIARRASITSSSSPLKRERSEDMLPPDVMNKRRDTGEGKSMMPPPPIPSPVANSSAVFPTPMTNGTATPPVTPQLGDAQNSGMNGDPASRDRGRQQQMRTQQGNRQMSPPSNPNPGPPTNAVAGPSGSGPSMQHMYAMLQNPGHPFHQYMVRQTPGFQQMPVQMQLSRMLAAQAALQAQRERQNAMQSNSGGGGPFPGQTSPVSPMAQMSGGGGPSPQNSMFPATAGMDPRAMSSTPLPGGGGGGGGMNMGGITPQQRQLFLMQQQQRGGGGGGGGGMGNMNPGMGMNPQQLAFQQQQERMRMEQQRMAAAQQGGSPPHPSSPMMSNDFPALRSNASIPGIARIARSPSDGTPGGMTPRMAPARGPSMGPDDFQRAMMQQRGGMPGQGGGGGFGGPQGFPSQQPSQGWQQNQLQQQAMMQGGGGGGGQYGMGGPRPGSAYGGAPSPPGGGGGMSNQNWGQGQGGYPFAGSPGASADLGMQRHMSGTPAPHMQQNSPPTDGDFDPFNWA